MEVIPLVTVAVVDPITVAVVVVLVPELPVQVGAVQWAVTVVTEYNGPLTLLIMAEAAVVIVEQIEEQPIVWAASVAVVKILSLVQPIPVVAVVVAEHIILNTPVLGVRV